MGLYHLSVDHKCRMTIPGDVRDVCLPGGKLGVIVDINSIPGNQDFLGVKKCVCLRLITEDRYNDMTFKIEAMPTASLKRDVQQWFERYVCLQPVDKLGCLLLPREFLQEVLAFEPPGELVLAVLPGEVMVTTHKLYDEACLRLEESLMSDPVARDELGL